MLNILNMVKTGTIGNLYEFKFDFEFDEASTLPVNFIVMEQKKYLIAEGSTAKNVSTNTYYTYNGVGKKWVKTLSKTPMPTPTTDTNITENGNYSVVNNDTTGYTDVTVNVFSEPAVLINKDITINGNYNASSDDANGYSTVNVNVPNTYTVNDNGKVVNNQELVAQAAYPDTVTTNNTYDTTNYNYITVDVANTYTAEDEGKVVDNGALVAQTAMTEEITENGVVDTTLYNSVTVNVSGGGGSSGNDVIFYDYDGSVVTSYSAPDFANLSAMPANPTHTGLTAQGWNWSLADAKAYVASYGKLNIGQMYITSDGKTRLYFVVTEYSRTADLYLDIGDDTKLDIDWGDNSTHTTWTSDEGAESKSHEYASAGRYVIAIEVITGEFYFVPSLSNMYKVEIGNGVTNIGENAFSACSLLSLITIPNSITSIGDSAFYECFALSSITIPNGVTSIGDSAFYWCTLLSSVTIPDGVTSIGTYAFQYCYVLSSITIPDSVTDIGDNAFEYCYALSSITIPDTVTSIGGSAFSDCYALSSITIPDSVTSIGSSAFRNCCSLLSVTIPTSIEGDVFQNCYALSLITISVSVTGISSSVFESCYALSSVTFESSTPPYINSTFSIPYTCIIRVPQGSLSAYTSAYNYPDPEYYIYEEY